MSNAKKLSQISAQLSEQQQKTLIDFAGFLLQQQKSANPEFPNPVFIEREEGETVITAIKRLKKIYHMLNMDSLLNETSTFMAQYMLQGRDVNEVINDLEVSFKKHYDQQKQEYLNTND